MGKKRIFFSIVITSLLCISLVSALSFQGITDWIGNLFGEGVSYSPPSSCQTFVKYFDNNVMSDVEILTDRIINASDNLCSGELPKFNGQLNSLLELRKNLLKEAIKKNPSKALKVKALPENVKESANKVDAGISLSPSEDQIIEERGEFRGSLEVLHVDDFENYSNSKFIHYLKTPSASYELFASDELPVVLSRTEASVTGVALEGVMAVSTGQGAFQNTVPPGSPASENFGSQKTLIIIANIGSNNASANRSEVERLMLSDEFGSVKDYYDKNSYGETSIDADVYGPYNLPDSVCNIDEMLKASLMVAREDILSSGKSFNNYSRVVLDVPNTPCVFYNGQGSIGKQHILLDTGEEFNASVSWDFHFSSRTVGHELGHNFGVHHANLYRCGDNANKNVPFSYECDSFEYGDPYDIMGSAQLAHMNAPHKKEIGWLSNDNIATVTSGDYILYPLEISQPAGYIQMIKMPIETETSFYPGGQNLYYVLELRRPLNYDSEFSHHYPYSSLFEGITIRIAKFNEQGDFTYTQTNLIRPTYNEYNEDYILKIGKNYVDNINGYSITLNSIEDNIANLTINQIPRNLPDFNKPLNYYNFDNLSLPTDKYGNFIGVIEDHAGYSSGGYSHGAIPNNGGLSFDGIDDYVKISKFSKAFIEKNNEFTFSTWVNLRPTSSEDYKNSAIYIADSTVLSVEKHGLTYNAKINTFLSNGMSSGNIIVLAETSLKSKKWYHIVSTYNGTDLMIYINGERKAILSSSDKGIDSPRLKFYSGENFIGGSEFSGGINGTIDEFKVYAKALNDSQIFELYSSAFKMNPKFGILVNFAFEDTLFVRNPNNTIACHDTDGGTFVRQKGSIIYNQTSIVKGKAKSLVKTSYTDKCSKSNKTVAEWYCDPTKKAAKYITYTCPNGCKDGACIL